MLVSLLFGEVAEWLTAAGLKTVKDREVLLEFESLPLRQILSKFYRPQKILELRKLPEFFCGLFFDEELGSVE